MGGTSKMFWKFVEDVKPRHLLSYSANSWFSGSGYEKIGMDTVGDSGPSYNWVSFRGELKEVVENHKNHVVGETSSATKVTRESVQCKKYDNIYPELNHDILDHPEKYPVGGLENEFCSELGMYKINNAGNCRHEMMFYWDDDPRTWSQNSVKDTVTFPFYCGSYIKGMVAHPYKMDYVPECYISNGEHVSEDVERWLNERTQSGGAEAEV